MKWFMYIAVMIMALPGASYAGRLQCTLPSEVSEAHLISGGTMAMMDYLKAASDAEVKKLRTEYQVDSFENQGKKAEELAKEKNRAYTEKIATLRKNYISLLNLTLQSVQSSINPSTSTLGDVMFFYTVKNNTDRIITDITYKPLINGKGLSTTTSLVLEFIDPVTLKSGLGAHETMTNQGHDPEKFSFFIGEVPADELKNLKSDIGKKFSISIIDMHFSNQKGYKGQIKTEPFEEAFSGQLKPMEAAYKQAEAEAKAMKEYDTKTMRQYAEQKNRLRSNLKKSLDDLKKTSIRYTARPDKKGRYIFENVAPGNYFIYAEGGKGQAVLEKITIGEKKKKESFTQMKKDPFAL